MKLFSQMPSSTASHPITYGTSIVLFGSCFSEHIGARLGYYKFRTLQNPFGILFHPKAIEVVLQRVLCERWYRAEDLFFHLGQWRCFEVHSALAQTEKEAMLRQLNALLEGTRSGIRHAGHIFITLGTSWVYHHRQRDAIVANCHKVPQKEFGKHLLSVSAIQESLYQIMVHVQDLNPNAHVVFTVSPVRHLKDGFQENQRSKAHLITALHAVLEDPVMQGKASYFPSYEIMMDELRDYRFYGDDLVHPNALAIRYIWEKFERAYFTETTRKTMERVDVVQKGLGHIPFHAEGEAHQQFKKALQQKIAYLQDHYPFMVFDGAKPNSK